MFPDEALASLIKTYLAYLGVPLSDEDEETATPPATLDDVFKVISVRFVFAFFSRPSRVCITGYRVGLTIVNLRSKGNGRGIPS